MSLTPRLERAIERAKVIAAETGCDYVGVAHLLLALASHPDTAPSIEGIDGCKIDAETLAAAIRKSIT